MVSFRPRIAKVYAFYSFATAIGKVITFCWWLLTNSPAVVLVDGVFVALTFAALVVSPFVIVYGLANVTSFADPLTFDVKRNQKTKFSFFMRYNKGFGLTLRLRRVSLTFPRCVSVETDFHMPCDGSDAVEAPVQTIGQFKTLVLEWEKAYLKTRNYFLWRLLAILDGSSRFTDVGMDSNIDCVFEFTMAYGLYKSSIKEKIRITHPIPKPA